MRDGRSDRGGSPTTGRETGAGPQDAPAAPASTGQRAMNARARWLARNVLIHEPELRSWLRRGSLPGVEIDDVIQESYAILAGLHSVEHIHRPRVYFFQVVKSVILQGLRRSRIVSYDALTEFDALLLPDDAPSPEAVAFGHQELGRLAALIEQLPSKCRQAFVLRKVHGLTQREAALEMGVSENTIEKHIGKALASLGLSIGRGGSRRRGSSYDHGTTTSEQTDGKARDRR